jgi:hypothetical protein
MSARNRVRRCEKTHSSFNMSPHKLSLTSAQISSTIFLPADEPSIHPFSVRTAKVIGMRVWCRSPRTACSAGASMRSRAVNGVGADGSKSMRDRSQALALGLEDFRRLDFGRPFGGTIEKLREKSRPVTWISYYE